MRWLVKQVTYFLILRVLITQFIRAFWHGSVMASSSRWCRHSPPPCEKWMDIVVMKQSERESKISFLQKTLTTTCFLLFFCTFDECYSYWIHRFNASFPVTGDIQVMATLSYPAKIREILLYMPQTSLIKWSSGYGLIILISIVVTNTHKKKVNHELLTLRAHARGGLQ